VRAHRVKAAIVAAALLGGGSLACAQSLTPGLGLFFTPANRASSANTDQQFAPLALPFGPASSAAPIAAPSASPFAAEAESPFGALTMVGYSAAATVPHLLSGGLIAQDGPVYSVRDLEIVDRVSDDVALEFGYDLDLGNRFDMTDVRSNPSYDGLFLSPADRVSPFSPLDDRTYFAGATMGLGNGLSVSLGESLLNPGGTSYSSPLLPFLGQVPAASAAFDQPEMETAFAGANWYFAPWGDVGLVASHTSAARSDLLGGAPAPGFSLVRAQTSSVGANAKLGLGNGWVTSFSYNENVTQLDLRPAGGTLAGESLHGRSYGLAVSKHGLFGDDVLGLAVSRPLDVAQGGIDLGAATADPFDGFISQSTHPILGSSAQETDVELGYVTTFMDGALALQANAGYQTNVAGQSGNNGVTVLSRAKINF
jgi:hypothetical protein